MYDYSDAPTLKKFALSDARIRGVMGPFGSGKSSAMVMEIIKRAHEQAPSPDGIRRTRWAVVRNCYDDQTEILTEERGWQLFRKLLPTDKVATLDGDQIVYKLPKGVAKHQYQGDLIGYDGEGIDFLVTPEHEMWVSKRRTRKKVWGDYEAAYAKDIYGSQTVRVRRDAKWKGTPTDLSTDQYEWLGFWFAEGHYCVTTGNSRRCVITQCKPEGKKYAIDLFARAGLGLRTQYEGSNHFGLRLKDKLAEKIITLISESGLAVNKKIPYEIKNAPAKHLRAFLHGYIMGDGCTAGGATRIYTSSKVMADDLQEMCLKAGWVSNLSSRDRRGKEFFINGVRTKSNSEEYNLTILCPKKYRPILQVNPNMTNHLQGWYKKPYDGFVYCVEMEKVPVCVRRNGKHFWCLRSFPQLKDTTIRTFHDWFPPKMFGEYRISDHNYIITAFPGVQIEIMFRALDRPDQIANLLSLEITGAWINEAREIPKSIFTALDGRIGRYPAAKDGGCTWMGIFLDTNPPDEESWWFTMFEKRRPVNAAVFKQPSGLSPHAENTKHLPKNYYKNLAIGKDEMYIRVYIHGQYGYVLEGEPVFKSFKDNVHVAAKPPEPHKHLDLLMGVDFGLNPSVVLGQIHPRGQLVILDELTSDGMGLKQFCINRLLPLLRTKYHGFKVMGYGDPAGTSRSPTDESTCFDILHSTEIGLTYVIPAPTNALLPRIGAVEAFLNKMVDGEPGFVLSPDCSILRKAMNGAYHYDIIPGNKEGMHKEKPSPCKDDYSHIADALQELCLYVDEKNLNDARHKAFLGQLKRPQHRVSDALVGY